MNQLVQEIRALIAAGKIEECIKVFGQLLENSPHLDEVIQQSSRLSNIRRQVRLGTVDYDNANLTVDRISVALLDLLKEIETTAQYNPSAKKEVEAYASEKAKKEQNQNNQGGGDNIGRDNIGGNKTGNIGGDYVGGNKIHGDYVAGDKVMGDKVTKNIKNNWTIKMSMFVDSVLHFFNDFISLLTKPTKFIQSVYYDPDRPAVQRGLLFYIIASIIAFFFTVWTPDEMGTPSKISMFSTSPKFYFEGALYLFTFILSCFAVSGIWRLFGRKIQPAKIIVILSFMFGATHLLSNMGHCFSRHITLLDPRISVMRKNHAPVLENLEEVAKLGASKMLGDKSVQNSSLNQAEFAQLQQDFEALQQDYLKITDSPLYKFSMIFNAIISIAIAFWFFRMWRIFREEDPTLTGFTLYGSLVASYIVFSLLSALPEVVEMSKLMQNLTVENADKQATENQSVAPVKPEKIIDDAPVQEEQKKTVVPPTPPSEKVVTAKKEDSNQQTYDQAEELLKLMQGESAHAVGQIMMQSGLNIRDSPNVSNSSVLTTIPYNARIIARRLGPADNINGNMDFWVWVEYKGYEGWAWSHWIQFDGL